ncbi:hypothetical protein [Phenylobacterium sp.]|uniref:hypothetical protein n=1 Tax=Phenylobacterium sp. TaxID=1871053 RepID=UPI003918CC05
MAKGKLADSNLIADATLSGGVWHADYGLAQLQTDRDYIGSPARCLDRTDLAKTRFRIAWSEPRVVDMLVLLFHTMSLSAKYRVETLDEDLATVLGDTGWLNVTPSIYDPTDLEFLAENFFSGTVTQGEIDLYPRHLWAPIEPALAFGLDVFLDDSSAGAGHLDIGGAWAVASWSPEINFERGHDLVVLGRDVVDETPSGRRIGEERPPQREQTLSYSMLTDAEARRFIDASMRARSTRTVLFAPDTDDPAALIREAFPATFSRLPGARFTYPGLHQSGFALKEILA